MNYSFNFVGCLVLYRNRRDQTGEENEFLRRTITQRKDTLSQCEHDMDKAKQAIGNTIQALRDVLQVCFYI